MLAHSGRLHAQGRARAVERGVGQAVLGVANGGKGREAATEYVDSLQRQGRYARDVY